MTDSVLTARTPHAEHVRHATFAERLLAWFDVHGRHGLPWQVSDDPYKVWVSEIMLQQTQVKTVLGYFERFITRFPTVFDLGRATWDEVAPYWAGLGYYARARNLHKAAGIVADQGDFPTTLEGWIALPGIGRSTAGALMSLGLRQYGVIMDGNVKRVLSRFDALDGDSTRSAFNDQLWQLATQLTPHTRTHDYTQAIMDLGATICTPKKPLCLYCPFQDDCQAYQQDRVLELPYKPSKKPIPTRYAIALLLQDGDHTLWQQRPPHSLWGGLWCLPMIDIADETQTAAVIAGLGLPNCVTGRQIRHTFTHFHWQIQLVIATPDTAAQAQLIQADAPIRWLSIPEALALGVPEAMRKLLI